MFKEEASSLLVHAGMVLSPKGRLYDSEREYTFGKITNDDIIATDGHMHTLMDVDSFTFMDPAHVLEITYCDESIVQIPGKILNNEEEGSVETVSLAKMPSTISELNAIFPVLYPHAGDQLYYDELQERAMVDMAMFDRPKEGLVPITDVIVSIYYEHIELKLASLGYFGKPPSYTVRDNVLNIQIHNNSRNLFRDWVESHVWDGKPRLRTWFQDTFGASAPPLEKKNLEERYLGDVAEAWFIGGIKRMYSETKHEIIPVLIGDQGIGKGQALQYTAGRNTWYKDTMVDIKKPKEFLDSVRGSIIVELSESTQIRGPDSELIKAFLSQTSDQIRKAYARYEERYPRHFIFAASSNLDNIFTDITGNRRFFPMYCSGKRSKRKFSEDRSVGQYDVEQVWAEALEMYKKGHKWYLNADSAAIARTMQDFCTQENSNITVIDDWLNDPLNGYTEIGARISKEIILRDLFSVPANMMPPRDIEHAIKTWMNGQKSWSKIDKTIRVGGKSCRGYERVAAPGEMKEIDRLGIVDSDYSEENSIDTIMRERAERYGFRDTGDAFPTEGLTDQMLNEMMDLGYIYQHTINPPVYKLGYLP